MSHEGTQAPPFTLPSTARDEVALDDRSTGGPEVHSTVEDDGTAESRQEDR